MGSSGLLLVGVVALWLFGAMPHWVRRSEALAAEHAAAEPFAQRTVPARRRAAAADLADATTSSGILGRPRRDDGPRQAAAGAARTVERQASPAAPRTAAHDARPSQRRPPTSRPSAPRAPHVVRRRRRLAPLVLVAAVLAAPALLAVGGASATTVVLTVLALAVLGPLALRVRARRAAVRRRALARRRAAARPWLVSSSGPAVRRPAAQRSDADGGSGDRRHAVGA